MSEVLANKPPPAEQHATELVRALAKGDEWALAHAYSTHREAVWAFSRRLIGEDAAAEDLVHEVFVRLPRAIRGFRGDSSLQTFLVAMAVNHARHHVRAAARRRQASIRLAREPQSNDAACDPVEASQLAQALTVALDNLPLDQRVAFVLCHVEERSHSEAAALTGASEGTMRARVFHARRKLQEALAGWQPAARSSGDRDKAGAP